MIPFPGPRYEADPCSSASYRKIGSRQTDRQTDSGLRKERTTDCVFQSYEEPQKPSRLVTFQVSWSRSHRNLWQAHRPSLWLTAQGSLSCVQCAWWNAGLMCTKWCSLNARVHNIMWIYQRDSNVEQLTERKGQKLLFMYDHLVPLLTYSQWGSVEWMWRMEGSRRKKMRESEENSMVTGKRSYGTSLHGSKS